MDWCTCCVPSDTGFIFFLNYYMLYLPLLPFFFFYSKVTTEKTESADLKLNSKKDGKERCFYLYSALREHKNLIFSQRKSTACENHSSTLKWWHPADMLTFVVLSSLMVGGCHWLPPSPAGSPQQRGCDNHGSFSIYTHTSHWSLLLHERYDYAKRRGFRVPPANGTFTLSPGRKTEGRPFQQFVPRLAVFEGSARVPWWSRVVGDRPHVFV